VGIFMGITVAQALELEALEQITIRAGHTGLERPIEQVLFLDELSNGHKHVLYLSHSNNQFARLPYDSQTQCEQIQELVRQHSSGLIVHNQQNIDLTSETIALANKLEFPLMELRSPQSEGEIAAAVAASLMHEQNALLERQRLFQQQLVDLMLRGFGLEHLVRATAHRLRRPVFVVGAQNLSQAFYDLDEVQAYEWYQVIVQNRPARARSFELPINGLQTMRIFIAPLPGIQRPGWIATTGDEALSREQQTTLDQAASIIALELMQHSMFAASQHERQQELIEALLAHRFDDENKLLRDAEQIGLDLNHCRAVIQVYQEEIAANSNRINTNTPFVTIQTLRQISPSTLISQHNDDLLLFIKLSGTISYMRQELQRISQELQQDLYHQGYRHAFVAVGKVVDSPIELGTSYRTAQGALRLRRVIGNNGIVVYDDAQHLVMLSEFATRTDVQEWLRDLLGNLIDYDQRNKTNLVYTLEVALDQGGALNVTADLLTIHPNTLKYRLQRVEEILELNPFASPHRLAYHIATKLARLQS
jgi:sugar diacid utilization regulator